MGVPADVPLRVSTQRVVGREVQARPRLESTTRFQSLIAEKDKQCFQLEPLGYLSLRPYSVGRCRRPLRARRLGPRQARGRKRQGRTIGPDWLRGVTKRHSALVH